MNVRDQDDWIRRLAFSLLFSAAVVGVSTIFFVVVPAHPSKTENLASYIFGVPLLPGWAFVLMFFGEWRSIHQGQIALVPLISLFVDWGLIFFTWQLLLRTKHRNSVEITISKIDG